MEQTQQEVKHTDICRECGQELESQVIRAYNDLYGGYRVDLMKLGTEIERSITALADNRLRYPTIYAGAAISVQDVVADAIAGWLGHDMEALHAAASHRLAEAQP